MLGSSSAAMNHAVEGIDTQGLEQAASLIEAIPDSALKSQEAFDTWKAGKRSSIRPQSAAKCALSVAAAVLSNGLAVAKVLKIKAAIKTAGGATKFAKAVTAPYKAARAAGLSKTAAIKAAAKAVASGSGGSAAVDALLEFFSIRAVANDCFGADI